MYTEDLTDVKIEKGYYNIRFGTKTPITFKSNKSLWYELFVGSEAITEKIKFDAIPFSLGSKFSEAADTAMFSNLTISQIQGGNDKLLATKEYVLDAIKKGSGGSIT